MGRELGHVGTTLVVIDLEVGGSEYLPVEGTVLNAVLAKFFLRRVALRLRGQGGPQHGEQCDKVPELELEKYLHLS